MTTGKKATPIAGKLYQIQKAQRNTERLQLLTFLSAVALTSHTNGK